MNEKEILEIFEQYHYVDSINNRKKVDEILTNKPLWNKILKNEKMLLEIVQRNQGTWIRYIPLKFQTDEMVKISLSKEGCNIEWVKQTPERCLLAVSNNSFAINYIKKQTKELCFIALKKWSRVIEYIKNPTEEMQLFAIEDNYRVIEYIKNPTEEMCLKALEINWKALYYIKNPTEEMCLKAININAKYIRYINNNILTFEMIKKAVDQDLEALMFIPYEIINKKNVKYFCKKTAKLFDKVGSVFAVEGCYDCGYGVKDWEHHECLEDLIVHLLNFVGE